MRWENGRRSDNVEYSQGGRGKRKGFGIVGLIIAGVVAYVTHDSSIFFNALTNEVVNTSSSSGQTAYQPKTKDELRLVDFVKVILGDSEDTWGKLFAQQGLHYKRPKLVLFSGGVNSACGHATTQSGPFYCPGDQKIYLDLAFLSQLKKMGASGDFAFAYVITHEIGHHVSNLLGTLPKVNEVMARTSDANAKQLSIRLELQADCYAGVWANNANNEHHFLDQKDIIDGLNAASAVGDDKIVGDRPDLFTHGTSKQRVQWLQTGLTSGKISACDTFRDLRN